MDGYVKSFIKSFFATTITRQIRELYSATVILDLAIALVNIFEPVFLYVTFIRHFNLKTTLELILVFYLFIYILYFFTVPLGAKFAKRFGYENSIAVSTLFMVGLYFCLLGLASYPWLAALAALLYVPAKLFYWPAYHGDFARFVAKGEQGRSISNLTALINLVCISGPIIGGLVIQFYGFKVLFIIVAILMLVSNIPMLITKEQFEPSGFSYFDAYRRVLAKKHRRQFLAHLGYGEELIVLVIWPIFMYIIVTNFLGLGLLVTLSTLVTTLLGLYVGNITDRSDPRSVLRFGTIFYFFSWLMMLLARTTVGAFFTDVYSRVSKQTLSIPITAMTYEKAQDGGHVMKTVVFYEMSLVVGKIIAMLIALVLLQIFTPGWNAMFIMAAGMTLLYLLF